MTVGGSLFRITPTTAQVLLQTTAPAPGRRWFRNAKLGEQQIRTRMVRWDPETIRWDIAFALVLRNDSTATFTSYPAELLWRAMASERCCGHPSMKLDFSYRSVYRPLMRHPVNTTPVVPDLKDSNPDHVQHIGSG